MAFWGVEVKPGNPFTHFFDRVRGRLRISQATLGNGSATKKSVVQCNVGNKSPVLLCALLPDKTESCTLELEFEEADDVIFSVIGPRSVHLTGYYLGHLRNSKLDDDTESYGEDIANTETEESSHCNDEDNYEDSFIDDNDPEVCPPSPVSNDAVAYEGEEELDSEKPKKEKGWKRLKKEYQLSESDEDSNAPKPKVINRRAGTTVSESNDEDWLPISSLCKTEKSGNNKKVEADEEHGKETGMATDKDDNCVTKINSEVDAVLIDGNLERQADLPCNPSLPYPELVSPEKEPKPKKKRKERSKERNTRAKADALDRDGQKNQQDQKSGNDKGDDLAHGHSLLSNDASPEEDSKPKKRKKEHSKEVKNLEADGASQSKVLIKNKEGNDTTKDENISNDPSLKSKKDTKSVMEEKSDNCSNQVANGKQHGDKRDKKKKKLKTQENDQEVNTSLPVPEVRTLSNGLEIEELEMGNPDGKIACHGKKIKVNYAGKLVGGNVFDSNDGAPYKFRLGAGKVIDGWDIGLEGMRVGGRRRLKIPPSLGYGSQGNGENIPPNSWLVYDIELVGVH